MLAYYFDAGASIPPEAMMHFSPCFRFPPLFSINFQTQSSTTNVEFPPNFPGFSTFPSVSRKLLFPPTFKNFPSCFQKIHLLFTYFMCISFSPLLWPWWCICASPNARTKRPWPRVRGDCYTGSWTCSMRLPQQVLNYKKLLLYDGDFMKQFKLWTILQLITIPDRCIC